MKTYLILICAILFLSCHKQEENVNDDINNGKIVGYLKCIDSEANDNTLMGFFIISNNKDSLLSFNILNSISFLDTSELKYGIGFLDGDSVVFCYRNAKNEEIKYFDCPPNTMQNPTFYPLEDFSQVIITNINVIH